MATNITALTAAVRVILNITSVVAAASRPVAKSVDDSQTFGDQPALSLTFGTGAANANEEFIDRRTLAASTSESLNLSGGAAGGAVALKNPHANPTAIAATAMRCLLIVNESATGVLQVGTDATNNLTTLFGDNTDAFNIRPGGFALFAVGVADTGYVIATNEILKFANLDGANALTYRVYALLIG